MLFGLPALSAHAQDIPGAVLRARVSDWACGADTSAARLLHPNSLPMTAGMSRWKTARFGSPTDRSRHRRRVGAGRFRYHPSDRAPTGDFEWQLTKVDNTEWRAAVRLVGRVGRDRGSGGYLRRLRIAASHLRRHAIEIGEHPALVNSTRSSWSKSRGFARGMMNLVSVLPRPCCSRKSSNGCHLSEQSVNVAD